MKRLSCFCRGAACLATALGLLSGQVAQGSEKAWLDPSALSNPAGDLPVSHGPGTIVTSFEPPFNLATLNGQQGWAVTAAAVPTVTISNVDPDDLLQHMRILEVTTVADETLTNIFTPNLGTLPTNPHVFECRIKISNDGGADYWIQAQAPSQGFITWRIIFSRDDGTTVATPGHIIVVENPGSGFQAIDTGFVWTENAYVTLRIDYVPNGTCVYSINGTPFYTDLDTGNNAIGTRAEQIVIRQSNTQLANEFCHIDRFSLTPGTQTDGACCEPDGDCTITTLAACVAPNAFRGLGTTCQTGTCVGKCCQPDGFCVTVSAGDCAGAGFIFSGIGTSCNPLTPAECLGRCCMPDGSCLEDGPDPCVANGGTFGGVGVACGDGSLCLGRCCVGANTCLPNSSPNACAVAGGTLTLGGICQATNVFNFVTSVAIPDGPAGGGVGTPVTNVQTIAGQTGTISDLDVDIKITHTWVGDLVVDITHGATTVTVVDLMGQLTAAGGGCGSDNLNIILDDEGTGGTIEAQCAAPTAAAVSPPNFTPNNPLSAFDGMDPNGPWTISIRDTFQADVGTLTGWSLHFQSGASPCAPSCTCKGDLNGSGTVNGADINKFAQCVASGGGAGCACADINGGGINASDVTPFVNALIAGTACIP